MPYRDDLPTSRSAFPPASRPARGGHRLAGPRWEVYGHAHADPARVDTEIAWLLA